ncbi:MAG TPA: hypothetical protein VF630_14355 [Hymenobacter sp.]|jgi:hypothetical protein
MNSVQKILAKVQFEAVVSGALPHIISPIKQPYAAPGRYNAGSESQFPKLPPPFLSTHLPPKK